MQPRWTVVIVFHDRSGTYRKSRRFARWYTRPDGSHKGPLVFQNQRVLSWETR